MIIIIIICVFFLFVCLLFECVYLLEVCWCNPFLIQSYLQATICLTAGPGPDPVGSTWLRLKKFWYGRGVFSQSRHLLRQLFYILFWIPFCIFWCGIKSKICWSQNRVFWVSPRKAIQNHLVFFVEIDFWIRNVQNWTNSQKYGPIWDHMGPARAL